MTDDKLERILSIYSFIKKNLYLCRNDMNIGGQKFNSNLLVTLMTALNRGKQLTFGEYGLGKTTSSEYAISLIYGFPKEVVISSEIKGHPEQTEEKMVGRPDFSYLNRGEKSEERTVWSYHILLPPKIGDEINRNTFGKQDIVLEGIDRGNWKYMNDMIRSGDFSYYGIVNYKDYGNTELVEALRDRFDIAVESKHPGLFNSRKIRKGVTEAPEEFVEDSEITEKMFELLNSKQEYSVILAELNKLSDEFKHRVSKKIGFDLLTNAELMDIYKEMKSIDVESEVHSFYDLFDAELSSCVLFGQKRSNDNCPNCHYNIKIDQKSIDRGYFCSKTKNCKSIRSDKAIFKYARSLAYMLGKDEVTIEHVEKVIPFALWHKMDFDESYIGLFAEDERKDPLELHVAKHMVQTIKRRYVDLSNVMTNMGKIVYKGIKAYYSGDRVTYQEKLKEASEFVKGKDHPIFQEYLRSLVELG